MRHGLAGLTVRGRAFLAAGISAVICAIVLGQPALTRIGVLLVVLPLLCAVLVGRARYRFALHRTLQPRVVEAGSAVTVDVHLTSEGARPRGTLLLEEVVPHALGNRPRFVLHGTGSAPNQHLRYAVRADLRGRYEIGPMTLRAGDPFGMVEVGRSFRSTSSLIVTPRVIPLPSITLSGVHHGNGENRPRSYATGSAEDVTVRAYRRGDDLRRVHWRSSARVGDLMVRREEQPWQSRATVVLDNRAASHRGPGPASSLEAAVTAAAAITNHLAERGYSVRFMTAHGEDPALAAHGESQGPDITPILESLAVLTPTRLPRMMSDWVGSSGSSTLTIALLGFLSEDDLTILRQIRQHSGAAMALSFDAAAWDPSTEATTTTHREPTLLTAQGWRTVAVGPRDSLATVWQGFGAQRTRGGA